MFFGQNPELLAKQTVKDGFRRFSVKLCIMFFSWFTLQSPNSLEVSAITAMDFKNKSRFHRPTFVILGGSNHQVKFSKSQQPRRPMYSEAFVLSRSCESLWGTPMHNLDERNFWLFL